MKKDSSDPFRSKGVITNVTVGEEDHGIPTCMVLVDDSLGTQGFGGLCLSSKLKEYVKDLCATFDVQRPEDLVGKPCYALRCFSKLNAYIEGLEAIPSGKRFVKRTWAMKHFPNMKHPTPLQQALVHLQQEIESNRDAIVRCQADLKNIKSRYHAW